MRTQFSAEQVADRIRELGDELARAVPAALVVAIAEGARRFADGLVGRMRERGADPEIAIVRARRTVSGMS